MNPNLSLNQIAAAPRLARVVMPLIRLLNSGAEFSQAERTEIADAIQAAIRAHDGAKASQLLGGVGGAAALVGAQQQARQE